MINDEAHDARCRMASTIPATQNSTRRTTQTSQNMLVGWRLCDKGCCACFSGVVFRTNAAPTARHLTTADIGLIDSWPNIDRDLSIRFVLRFLSRHIISADIRIYIDDLCRSWSFRSCGTYVERFDRDTYQTLDLGRRSK